jgi:prophage regulatory protein
MTDRFISWNDQRNTLQRNKVFVHVRSDQSMGLIKIRTGREHSPVLRISDGADESGGGGSSTAVNNGSEVAASDDDDAGGDGDGDPDRRTSPKKSHSRGKRRNATAMAGALPIPQNPEIALWRLPTVLAHIPISRSHWWAGVASGRFPAPVRLSARCLAWKSADIRALIATFDSGRP